MKRRSLLKAAGLTAVGVGAVAAADQTSASAANEAPAPAGTVTSVGGSASSVTVTLDADGSSVSALSTIRHRSLHPGDRVVIEHDESGQAIASPLFISLSGPIEAANDRSITVSGRRCTIDPRSVVYSGSNDRQLQGSLSAQTLKVGTTVGLLCVDNRRHGTLTVQALYPGG